MALHCPRALGRGDGPWEGECCRGAKNWGRGFLAAPTAFGSFLELRSLQAGPAQMAAFQLSCNSFGEIIGSVAEHVRDVWRINEIRSYIDENAVSGEGP